MVNPLTPFYNAMMLRTGHKIERRRFHREPIVIGASPRSGTTVLLSILGAHPHIFAIPNQTYGFEFWDRRVDTDTGNHVHYPTRMDRIYREFVWNRLPASAVRWCEKTPKNVRYFGKILDYYADKVRLIHIVRDGRDVVVSKHPKHKPDEYWVPVEKWVNDVSLGLMFEKNPSVLTIRYEDLVNDYAATIARICYFIDEPVIDRMHDWLRHTNIRKSKHLHKPVQELYKDSIGRWRNDVHKKRIAHFMRNKDAVSLLEKLGYDMD